MEKVLSVAVPAYQVEKYIGHCLDHFVIPGIGQYVEVLVIDDGSSDATGSIAQSYQKKYPMLFRYIIQENGGHGSAVNTGIRNAQGKYFMVADGDDWLDSADFWALVEKLAACDVDLAVSHYTRVSDGQNVIIASGAPVYEKVLDFEKLDPAAYYFVLPAVCYRTCLLREMNLKLPEHICYDDLVYIMEPMLYVKKVVFFDLNYYRYRVGHPSQSTAQENLAVYYRQHRKVVMRILRFYEQHKNDTSQSMYLKTVAGKALKDHYYILLRCEPDMKKARQRLLKLDAVLKKTDPAWISRTAKEILFLNMHRITSYRFLPAFRKIAALKNRYRKENV